MRSKKITLVIVPLLLTACSNDKVLYQDVYNSQRDCVQDWSYELCESDYGSNSSSYSSSGSGGWGAGRYIGPQYYKGNRNVKLKQSGKKVKAYTNRSESSPRISRTVNTYAKSTPVRGGFGGSSTSSSGG